SAPARGASRAGPLSPPDAGLPPSTLGFDQAARRLETTRWGYGGCRTAVELRCRARVLQDLVQHGLGLLLGGVEGEGQLRDQDLPGLRQHVLLPGGQALFLLADGEIPHDLSHLVDVSRRELREVGLVAATPVGGDDCLVLADE